VLLLAVKIHSGNNFKLRLSLADAMCIFLKTAAMLHQGLNQEKKFQN
jgi:hypothetical protein